MGVNQQVIPNNQEAAPKTNANASGVFYGWHFEGLANNAFPNSGNTKDHSTRWMLKHCGRWISLGVVYFHDCSSKDEVGIAKSFIGANWTTATRLRHLNQDEEYNCELHFIDRHQNNRFGIDQVDNFSEQAISLKLDARSRCAYRHVISE